MRNGQSTLLTDTDIVRQYLLTQDPAYFDVLYEKYSTKIYYKCISLLKDEHAAKDAVQDIFTKVLLSLSTFTEKSQFSTWIYSVSYNYCIDALRKKKRGKILFSDEADLEQNIASEEVPDEELFAMEMETLRKVLDEIPEGDKAVLMMKYYDDMSLKEIADALDKSESSIKMKIMRAKSKALECYLRIIKNNA